MLAKIGSIILIAALGFLVYGNSLQGKFLWDDEYLIKYNTYLRSFSNLAKVFSNDIGHGSGRKFGFYRPVQMLTYTIDYSLYKLDERGYHLTNVILHILTAICIYIFFNLLYGRRMVSLVAGLLYVVHPLNTAIVSYISGRADSMVVLFMLLSFIFYVKDMKAPAWWSYALIFITYGLALLSKETSLIFPVLLVLYHYSFRKDTDIKRFVPVVTMTLVYILVRVALLEHIMMKGPHTIGGTTTTLQRLPGFFAAMTAYAGILVVPVNLRMGRGMPLFSFSDPRAMTGIVILIALISSAFYFKKRKGREMEYFGLLWFLITILPVSNIYPLNAYMAEHWLSLPSIGLFLIAGDWVDRMCQKPRTRLIVLVAVAGIMLSYGYLTFRQNAYWKGPVEFHARTLKYSQNNIKAMTDLARQYEMVGKRDEAIELYKRAIQLDPFFPIPYNNLGYLYHNIGRDDEAIELYKKAIENDPGYPDALNNLAVVYQIRGKFDEAIGLYKKSIAANPNFEGAYSNLGVLYSATGKPEEAMEAYKTAIKINPSFENAYYNLALLYSNAEKLDEAVAMYKKALELNPDHPQANNNIAMVYYKMKQYDLAIKHIDKAAGVGFKVDPQFLEQLAPYRK